MALGKWIFAVYFFFLVYGVPKYGGVRRRFVCHGGANGFDLAMWRRALCVIAVIAKVDRSATVLRDWLVGSNLVGEPEAWVQVGLLRRAALLARNYRYPGEW